MKKNLEKTTHCTKNNVNYKKLRKRIPSCLALNIFTVFLNFRQSHVI
jgi:hypothetical protein